MTETLLTSEAFVKECTSISDNIAGKYLLPSIREAQEIKLKGILGDTLLAKLKALVKADTIGDEDNEVYYNLLVEAQYFLAYSAVVELSFKVSYKIANAGVVTTSDDNVGNASLDEIAKAQEYYQAKADVSALYLQNFLLENRSDYPELSQSSCNKIKANLRSAATNGIFLGGARGKILR